jgi:hypothetical protein
MSPPLRATSYPPTHWHAETYHEPRRGSFDLPRFTLKGAARLSFPARIGRAPFYRARSASKKDGLAAPFLFFSDRALREHRGLTELSLALLALDLRRLMMKRGNLRANKIGKVLVP